MVLKDPRFKSCERIHTIGFSLFLKIKSLYVCLSVPNCSLFEYIFEIFTLVKCRAYTNFDLSRIYEEYFQLICNLVMYLKIWLSEKICGVDSLKALETWVFQHYQNIRKINC